MPYTVAAAAAGKERPSATAAKIKTASHTEFRTLPNQPPPWITNRADQVIIWPSAELQGMPLPHCARPPSVVWFRQGS